jgi:lipoprotein-anchoring transpeptidase ErfK/SrfK
MSGYRWRKLKWRALAVCATITIGAMADRASAQYCDERFDPCRGYPNQRYPEQGHPSASHPQLDGRYAPVQRREMAPEPAPRRTAPHPGTVTPADTGQRTQYAALYAPVRGEPFPIPAVRWSDIDPKYLRTPVAYPTSEPPGTIVIDARQHFLYFVQGGGRAIRYGVGVGRQGFGWSGVATIKDKQEWPDWYPPKEMIARQPELRRQLTELQSGIGMPGGPRNPLGARAMYLWQGNKDTLYRIHGTFEPKTIGKSVSSGCIRMINQDVIDLYRRTAAGAKVVVISLRS